MCMAFITPLLYFNYFLFWINYFFFILIDTCEKNWHCGISEMWLNRASVYSLSLFNNLIVYWVMLELLLFFTRKKMVHIYPCFPILFIQFSKTVLAVQWIMNQLESWANLQYWHFAISNGFCNSCSHSKLFRKA